MQNFNAYLSNSLNYEIVLTWRAISENDSAALMASLWRLHNGHGYLDFAAIEYLSK